MADVIVVGSGPNGLAAAIVMARAGRSVLVLEANATVGGGARSAELTLPGFVHDICSAVHPLAVGSPFFSTLPLAEHGLEWIHPPAPLAHPLDDGTAAMLERSIEATGATLGRDAGAYAKFMRPFANSWDKLAAVALGPLRATRHPVLLARFGLKALRSAEGLATSTFDDRAARALFAGVAAHSALPLSRAASAGFGLVLMAAGHAFGWPIPRGGSHRIAEALASYLRSLGGRIETGARVRSLREVLPGQTVLLDLTPRQILAIAGDWLPNGYRRGLERYRYGPGVFKLDWALDGPIPWRSPDCSRAATVHLGGTLEEIAASEQQPLNGRIPERPFIIVVQPTLFDPSRAPAGKHTAWAYCHVPLRSTVDMTDRIEAQIERFAPGFRDQVLARSTLSPAELERRNANLVGGDINGGSPLLSQLLLRPTLRLPPYSTPVRGLYLCSSSTPPGGGVHGMCGYYAAEYALRREG